MVVIRLSRGGSNKSPFYHIVVADSRCPRDGRYIESVGFFNPLAKGKAIPVELKRERIEHWLKQGAQMSTRIKSLVALWDSKASKAA